jgi:hypothetical protein
MPRDHTIKSGSEGYVECGICARTIRKEEAVEQRGILVCPNDVDSPSPEEVEVTG